MAKPNGKRPLTAMNLQRRGGPSGHVKESTGGDVSWKTLVMSYHESYRGGNHVASGFEEYYGGFY